MNLYAAVCYLCLDTVDDAGQPLRRDCACRGTDAGFVHLSCLTKYLAPTSERAHDMDLFRDPWRVCPSCRKEYQNELAVDIANKFVLFVRGRYPDNTLRQVEALNMKLDALMAMLDRLQPVQKREAGVTANVLLSLIDRMKGERRWATMPVRYSQIEAYAYGVHGRIALEEGTEESSRRAVVHFEKALKVFEEIGFDEGIAIAKSFIATSKSMYKDDSSNEEDVLTTSRDLYELRTVEFGEDYEYTILAGNDYARDLLNANQLTEAMELLSKLLITNKRVLGLHHKTTKEVESTLKQVVSKLKL